MPQKYKLKEAARQFFDKDTARRIDTLDCWQKQTIPIQLLEEVSNVHIEYGHKNGIRTDLCEWKNEGEVAEFKFTVVVSEIGNKDYESVSIPYVMDKIQKVLDEVFK